MATGSDFEEDEFNDDGLRDPEIKRDKFSKALFNTLAPAVKQCDEVVRGVFQSQNKVLTQLSNLEESFVSLILIVLNCLISS